jgi:preprotein translocase subunit SecG
MGIIIAIHVIVCISLIGLILIQRGRGGGLVDSFQTMESVFGTKTTAFLTRTTSILAIVFFLTCLSLAFFSLRQNRSLLRNAPVLPPVHNATAAQPAAVQESAPLTNSTTAPAK